MPSELTERISFLITKEVKKKLLIKAATLEITYNILLRDWVEEKLKK